MKILLTRKPSVRLVVLSAVFLAGPQQKPELSKTGAAASLSAPMQQGELRKHISARSLQTDRITAIVGLSVAPSFLSLQSSLSTICTWKPFGDFEFGSFTSVKFSAQTFFVFLEGYKTRRGNIQAVKAHCKIKPPRKGSFGDYVQTIFGSR